LEKLKSHSLFLKVATLGAWTICDGNEFQIFMTRLEKKLASHVEQQWDFLSLRPLLLVSLQSESVKKLATSTSTRLL